jgi:hypothetical protein
MAYRQNAEPYHINFVCSEMSETTLTPEVRNKPILKQEIAFAVVHLIPLGAIWTGATLFDWIVCGVLYVCDCLHGADFSTKGRVVVGCPPPSSPSP